MQIVTNGENLHEKSKPADWESKKKIISLSSAELAQRVVKVNTDNDKLKSIFSILDNANIDPAQICP